MTTDTNEMDKQANKSMTHPKAITKAYLAKERADACPHCGADSQGLSFSGKNTVYHCGAIIGKTHNEQSRLCHEREARQKAEADLMRTQIEMQLEIDRAEAEVERLTDSLKSCWHAANTYDGNYTKACDNVAIIAIAALKEVLNPTDK